MKRTFAAFVFAMLLVASPAGAGAGFFFDDTVYNTGPDQINRHVIHRGSLPTEIEAAFGAGRDIPLQHAVQQIAPNGWHGEVEGGIDVSKMVNWTGEKLWIKSLENLMKSINAQATLDWDAKLITLRPIGGPGGVGAPGGKEKAVAEVPVYVVRLKDGKISKTLSRWAKESPGNWQVSWEAPMDFPTTLEAKFSGSFEEVVDQLVTSLSSTEAPVQAVFYENKVVRVVALGTKIR